VGNFSRTSISRALPVAECYAAKRPINRIGDFMTAAPFIAAFGLGIGLVGLIVLILVILLVVWLIRRA
jgi:hypothetical protein